MASVSAFKTGLYVLALLVCGSLNTLTMKKLGAIVLKTMAGITALYFPFGNGPWVFPEIRGP